MSLFGNTCINVRCLGHSPEQHNLTCCFLASCISPCFSSRTSGSSSIGIGRPGTKSETALVAVIFYCWDICSKTTTILNIVKLFRLRCTREVHELAVSVQYFRSFRHSRKDRYFVDINRQFVDLPRTKPRSNFSFCSGALMNDLFLLRGDAASADLAPRHADCRPTFVNFILLHGVLMALSWGLFLQWGAFIARYFRHKDPTWFALHRVFQVGLRPLLSHTFLCVLLCTHKHTQTHTRTHTRTGANVKKFDQTRLEDVVIIIARRCCPLSVSTLTIIAFRLVCRCGFMTMHDRDFVLTEILF